ncbi:DUF3800 domain-containing protein [Thiohalocapsa sp. ML1]|jgi:hypothetical protein|uniref:DUF3800 domain-containing protein n=1 Tax=Thiohalocapsa sp. ML1 TaxID=1431688 RepID=UPI00073226D6|nr:DUF3800 domain-containing protein [Thiohalocapsa sp. ML1]
MPENLPELERGLTHAAMRECVYTFLDEGGNFDFSPGGTPYFTLTAVTTRRPFLLHNALDELRHQLLEQGRELLGFHCSEDRAAIRKQVFDCIVTHLDRLQIVGVVIEKARVRCEDRAPERFYPLVAEHLLEQVFRQSPSSSGLRRVIITDSLPIKKKRRAVEKALKQGLAARLPQEAAYHLLHHPSASHFGLQVADYCNWAIFRRFQQGERHYFERLGLEVVGGRTDAWLISNRGR